MNEVKFFSYIYLGEIMISFIAHRGAGVGKVENTIDALLGSLKKAEVNGIELDVRLTKDGELVIFHDFLINDASLPIRSISSLTLKEVQKYKLHNQNIHVSTLEDFLRQVHTNKKIMIELKGEKKDYSMMIEKLHFILKNYPELPFYICSFHYALLKKLKEKYPQYKVGLIIGLFQNGKHLHNTFDFVSLSLDYLDEWDFKKETFLWTINKISDLEKIIKKTTHVGIITDCPKKLFSFFNAYQSNHH